MAIDFSKIELENFFELYIFTHLTQSWYYTSADHEIVWNGNTYIPAAIKRGEFSKETELNNISFEITIPLVDMVKQYIANSPVYETMVSIYLYQDPSNVILAFQGRITKCAFTAEGNSSTLSIDEQTALTVKLPALLIQPACNHVLFGSGCGLAKADWKVDFIITNITTEYLELSGLEEYDENYFTQGTAVFENDIRWITRSYGNFLHLQMPFAGLEIGDTISLYPGCDKMPETCRDKYNNLARYLGMPYVPRKNPVIFGI